MTIFNTNVWTENWDSPQLFHRPEEYVSALDMFQKNLALDPYAPQVSYFDRTWTAAETESESDALACRLADAGVGPGDRVGLYLQNMPEFIMGCLAAWKVGAAVVPINPMYQLREFHHIAQDSGLKALIALEELLPVVAAASTQTEFPTNIQLVISTNGRRSLGELTDVPTPLLKSTDLETPDWAESYDHVLERYVGRRPDPFAPTGRDVAYVAYTSGTTGPPKGAMLSHSNVVFSAQTFRGMRSMCKDDVIFAMAPLFHVTGLISTVALGLLIQSRVVLGYRFEVATSLKLIDQYQVTFTVGATTVFIAFLENPIFKTVDISSLTKVICGGAPLPPSVVERYRNATGVYLYNGYGMTETASPTFGTPPGSASPVHPLSGSLALGVPVPDTECKLLDDDNNEVGYGEPGEILVRGPHVMLGYCNNPGETASAISEDGWLRTGDVATMDEQGWFYMVDRKKDQINASGFKVWPQEVEEVVYEHPAILEVAVIGVADEYRGETVVAFVSFREGASATAEELTAFTRERLAAFKVPRAFHVLDELPKTVTGKITRRSLHSLAIPKESAPS